MSAASPSLPPPRLEHVFDVDVELEPPKQMGRGRGGARRIIPIVGGTVTGAINGRILHVGADWQTQFDDDLFELDTRYAMETDDGAVIELRNFAYRHAEPHIIEALARGEDVADDDLYMRGHARLETGNDRYRWINRTLFLTTGNRRSASVIVSYYAIR